MSNYQLVSKGDEGDQQVGQAMAMQGPVTVAVDSQHIQCMHGSYQQ